MTQSFESFAGSLSFSTIGVKLTTSSNPSTLSLTSILFADVWLSSTIYRKLCRKGFASIPT